MMEFEIKEITFQQYRENLTLKQGVFPMGYKYP